eukprot:CAMPEP_0116573734 /NCGR_PEP_ID=MMETSP0397-20121206/18965_1 /TAXON_ID=216820 /ORGANISM="Cyclophora tenuis, Strain ECT3854" /LENGTH=211 /DNA_ID=CAMNT_0004102345 /DNA_START=21 /DNA_END=656 /DNA_ORIENTATION=+
MISRSEQTSVLPATEALKLAQQQTLPCHEYERRKGLLTSATTTTKRRKLFEKRASSFDLLELLEATEPVEQSIAFPTIEWCLDDNEESDVNESINNNNNSNNNNNNTVNEDDETAWSRSSSASSLRKRSRSSLEDLCNDNNSSPITIRGRSMTEQCLAVATSADPSTRLTSILDEPTAALDISALTAFADSDRPTKRLLTRSLRPFVPHAA